ncbi:hypothetical protein [Agilicoccus flavus]|uniref:hypothetical protein n=1 Tax=Agilicoccus flavus TaxID=2775968 RepID=UPI001CF6E81A|nr:hypothetical protein [Agilicoccus flavus]
MRCDELYADGAAAAAVGLWHMARPAALTDYDDQRAWYLGWFAAAIDGGLWTHMHDSPDVRVAMRRYAKQDRARAVRALRRTA